MSKAARNETLKMRATFRTNLAVALCAGGLIAPALQIYLRPDAVSEFNKALSVLVLSRSNIFTSAQITSAALVCFAIGSALAWAKILRMQAEALLRRLED
jgi:hypothetical protein